MPKPPRLAGDLIVRKGAAAPAVSNPAPISDVPTTVAIPPGAERQAPIAPWAANAMLPVRDHST